MTRRRGFTLVELMVALGLGLLIAGLAQRQLLFGRRLARAQAERMAMQDNVRTALVVLAGELAPLGRDEITPEASLASGLSVGPRDDLLAIAPDAVTYLASRGEGWVCGVYPGSPGEIVIAGHAYSALRAPRNTDSLLVYAEGDAGTVVDDFWLRFGVLSSVPTSCPGGIPGLAVRVVAPGGLAPGAITLILPGAPVRLAEVMEARSYRSAGKTWLGLRSVSTGETVTPVAGPLADSSAGGAGLTLRYRDAADAITHMVSAVRTVEIVITGVTDQPIYGRDVSRPLVDTFTLATRVVLRNGQRR